MEIALEFTQNDLAGLSRLHAVIYNLEGLSLREIASQRQIARKPGFYNSGNLVESTAMDEQGPICQVAIFPQDPTFPDSFKQGLNFQRQIVVGHTQGLGLHAAEYIIGEASTIAAALFAHTKTGDYLLTKDAVRSQTRVPEIPIGNSLFSYSVINLGLGNPQRGYEIYPCEENLMLFGVGILRLVVPVRK